MHDPCDDCLVKMCCGEVCWEKTNYNTLVENGRQNLLGGIFNGGGRNNSLLKQYTSYNRRARKNSSDFSKIRERNSNKNF